jgi:S1-C subfamily serine protease
VEDVLGDSPARTAGVQANDVLRMVDDQLLVNPNQLEALVRRAGKDKEIVLTILREGAEQKLTVKVGEKMLPCGVRCDSRVVFKMGRANFNHGGWRPAAAK